MRHHNLALHTPGYEARAHPHRGGGDPSGIELSGEGPNGGGATGGGSNGEGPHGGGIEPGRERPHAWRAELSMGPVLPLPPSLSRAVCGAVASVQI